MNKLIMLSAVGVLYPISISVAMDDGYQIPQVQQQLPAPTLEDLRQKDANELAGGYTLDFDHIHQLLNDSRIALREKRRILSKVSKASVSQLKGVQVGGLGDQILDKEKRIDEEMIRGAEIILQSRKMIEQTIDILLGNIKELSLGEKNVDQLYKEIQRQFDELKNLYEQIRESGEDELRIIQELGRLVQRLGEDKESQAEIIKQIEQLLQLLKGVALEKQPVEHVDHEQVDDPIISGARGLGWDEWLEQRRQASNIIQPMWGYEDESSIVEDVKGGPDLSFHEEDIVLSVDELKELDFDIWDLPGFARKCFEGVCRLVSFGYFGSSFKDFDAAVDEQRNKKLQEISKNIISLLKKHDKHIAKEIILRWLSQTHRIISPYLDVVEDYLKRADKRFSKYTDERKLELPDKQEIIHGALLELMKELKEDDRKEEEQRRLEESSSPSSSDDFSEDRELMIGSGMDQIGEAREEALSQPDTSEQPDSSQEESGDRGYFRVEEPFSGTYMEIPK